MSNKQKLSLLAIAFGVVSLSGCLPQEQSLPSTSGSTAPNTYLGFIGATAAQTMGATKVQLTWVPSSSSTVVAYNIYDSTFKFSPKLIKTILAPASSVLLTGLVAESYYAFRVRAADVNNFEDGNMIDVGAIPYAGVLPAQVQSSTSAIIPFNDGSNTNNINIYCYTGSTINYTLMASVSNVTLTQTLLTGLTAGTQYTCRAALVVNGIVDNNTVTTTFTPMGTASQLVFTTQPGSAAAGVALSPQPVVTIEDVNGNTVSAGPDSNAVITLNVSSNSPTAGTLSVSVAAVNGVATFTGVSIQEAGLKIISASKGDTSGVPFGSPVLHKDSASFTISPGSPSPTKSTITITPPGPLVANGASSYTVTMILKDQYGNAVSGITPHFSSSNNSDTLSQPTHSSDATGATTGSISTTTVGGVNGDGTRSLAISSPSAMTTDNVTAIFTPGPASQLAFTQQPQNSPAGIGGMTSAVIVAVQDANGNTVASTDPVANAVIGLAISAEPGTGALTGTTSVTAVNGIATFQGLGIDKTGNGYKLKAVASAFPTILQPNSFPFNITSASPSQVNITAGPASLLSSTSGSATTVCGTYTITLQDSGNNAANATTITTLNLTNVLKTNASTAGNALFYNSSNCSGATVSQVTIGIGHSTATISVRDPAAESINITVAGAGLVTGTYGLNVNPSQFILSGGPLTFLSSATCSTAFTITTQGANGNVGPVTANTNFAFSFLNAGVATSAIAYSDSNCTNSLGASPATIQMLAGQSTVTLFFKDQVAEGPITVALGSQNSMSNSTTSPTNQTITFLGSQISMTGPVAPLIAGGGCIGPFAVKALDAAGNVALSANNSLTLTGATSTSKFYGSSGCTSAITSVTLISGANNFWLSDTNVESLTIGVTDPAAAPLKMAPATTTTMHVWPYQLAWTTPSISSATINTGPLPNTTPSSFVCLPLVVASQYSSGTNVVSLDPVVVTLNGAGAFATTGTSYYSDSACTSPISTITLNGVASNTLYFQTLNPGTYSLTATDTNSVLQTSATLTVNAAAAPAWIGTRNAGPTSANNYAISFATNQKPVDPKFDGPQAVRSLVFDPTYQYLYALDPNRGSIFKYDYLNGKYLGWIGALNSNNGPPNGGTAGCLSVTNWNQQTPGWCYGGSPTPWNQITTGSMSSGAAMTSDGYNLYASSFSAGQGISMYNMQTGAFEGWIGTVAATATNGPAGSVANITAGSVATVANPGGVALSNTCASVVANNSAMTAVTPGFCNGGNNTQGFGDTAAGDGHMYNPQAMAYAQNILYVSDHSSGVVWKFDASGTNNHGKFLGWIGMINSTAGITCTSGTPLANKQTPSWCKGGTYIINNTGNANWNAGATGGLYNISGLYIDPANQYLYVTQNNGSSSRVTRFILATGAFDSQRIVSGLIGNNWINSIATDGISVFMTEFLRIVKLDSSMQNLLGWIGKINSPPTGPVAACLNLNSYTNTPTWCAGGSSIAGIDEASFSELSALAYDNNGYLLTGGGDIPSIKKFNASTGAYVGTMVTNSSSPSTWITTTDQATNYGFDDNSLYNPTGSFIDTTNNIMYIADAYNSRIKKILTTTGQVLGWIGGITTAPIGGQASCTTGIVGLMQASPGWCLGALPAILSLYGNGQSPISMYPLAPGTMQFPQGVTSDGTYLYVTDPGVNGWGGTPHRISRFNVATGAYAGWIGYISTITPSSCTGGTPATNSFTPGWCTGGNSTSANIDGALKLPGQIYYSSITQNIYVADYYNSRVSSYSATTGVFNGWIGKMGTNTAGCTTIVNGGTTYTKGWCKGTGGVGGSSVSSQAINNGDPGGGFGWPNSGWGYTANVGVTGDSNYLYIADPFNNRINRFWLQAGTVAGVSHVAGGFKDMLNTNFYLPLPSPSTWTTTAGAWGNPGIGAVSPTNVWPEGIHVDGTNLYYTVHDSSAVVKRLLSDGSFVGWNGGVSTVPQSCTGTGNNTITTPGWCYGGTPRNGTVFGTFNYGDSYISGDANYVYVSDTVTNRVTRLPKNP